jgi:hypothetical protein
MTGGAGARRVPPAESFPHDTELGSDGSQGVQGTSRGPFNARPLEEGRVPNCSECVINFERSMRAKKIVLERIEGGENWVSEEVHMKRLREIGANPKMLPGEFSNPEQVTNAVKGLRPGTRFSVIARRPLGGGGHIIAGMVRQNREVTYFETQSHGGVDFDPYVHFHVITHN